MRKATAVVAVLLLAGCGGHHKKAGPTPAPTATATPRPPTDKELITRLFKTRQAALGGGHAQAFAATSINKRHDLAVAAARRVARLGIKHPEYRLGNIVIRGRRALVHARLAYGVRGVKGDFGSDRKVVVRRRHGHWRLDRVDGTRRGEPWEVDDYVRTTTKHFVVFTPADLVAPTAALEQGYESIDKTVGKLARRYLVVIARDPFHARSLTTGITGLENLNALTDTQIKVSGPALQVSEIGSQRLVIIASSFDRMAPADQQIVVTHELTHAALAPVTSGRVPAWLVEGIALYTSGDDRRAEYQALTTVPTLAALSAPDAIAKLHGEAQRAAYATASAAAFTVADRLGRAGLLRLYLMYDKTSLHGGAGDPALTNRALHRFGSSLASLQAAVG